MLLLLTDSPRHPVGPAVALQGLPGFAPHRQGLRRLRHKDGPERLCGNRLNRLSAMIKPPCPCTVLFRIDP